MSPPEAVHTMLAALNLCYQWDRDARRLKIFLSSHAAFRGPGPLTLLQTAEGGLT
jgi:hypothetical protein